MAGRQILRSLIAGSQFRKRDPSFAEVGKYNIPKPLPKRFRLRKFRCAPDHSPAPVPRENPCTAMVSMYGSITEPASSLPRPSPPVSPAISVPNASRAHTREALDNWCSSIQNKKQQPPTLIDKMKQKIDSLRARMIYSRRLDTVEPPFGNLRYHKDLERFTLRSRKKANGQWKLYALVHNIEKLAHDRVRG